MGAALFPAEKQDGPRGGDGEGRQDQRVVPPCFRPGIQGKDQREQGRKKPDGPGQIEAGGGDRRMSCRDDHKGCDQPGNQQGNGEQEIVSPAESAGDVTAGGEPQGETKGRQGGHHAQRQANHLSRQENRHHGEGHGQDHGVT